MTRHLGWCALAITLAACNSAASSAGGSGGAAGASTGGASGAPTTPTGCLEGAACNAGNCSQKDAFGTTCLSCDCSNGRYACRGPAVGPGPCPGEPPRAGDPCPCFQTRTCSYGEDGGSVSQAHCEGLRWVVQRTAPDGSTRD